MSNEPLLEEQQRIASELSELDGLAKLANVMMEVHAIERMDDRTLAQAMMSEFENMDNTNRQTAILVEVMKRLSDQTRIEMSIQVKEGIL